MKCSLCSHEFDEAASRRSCAGCFNLGGCQMVRCPNCGYETPPEPEWIKQLKQKMEKKEKS